MKVGIDIGTTYSLAAAIDPSGQPMLIPDFAERGAFHTPSVVQICPGGALVGQTALDLEDYEPTNNPLKLFKRCLGTETAIYFDESGKPWYPETLTALLLKKLNYDVESFTSSQIEGAVITVPAHFDAMQRSALLAAAWLADVEVLTLLDEPVAAALHYGVKQASRDRVLLVYDLGGGTFDVAVLTMDDKGLYVLAKTGLTQLGGKEYDDKLSQILLSRYRRCYGHDPDLDSGAAIRLHRLSEELKIEMCTSGRRYVDRTVVLDSKSMEIRVSMDEFERAVQGEMDRAEAACLGCLKDAGLERRDVDTVLLVGGGTMVPPVRQRVQSLFSDGAQEVLYHEPGRAVAYGAALRSRQLTGADEGNELPSEFRGVTGHAVGIRVIDPDTGRATVDTLIRKNMPLPATTRKTYYSPREDQRQIVLEVVQYRDSVEDARSLGRLVVGPFPNPERNYAVEVEVACTENGTISVQARDPRTDVEFEQSYDADTAGNIARLAPQRNVVRSTLVNNV
jgi:molecular chaperone DnaK